MRADRSDKPETLNMGYGLTKKDYKIAFLTAVVQVQVDKMTFSTAQAFLFNHIGLGMLQHGPDAHCMTVSVNSSTADLSVGLLLESVVRMVWQCFWPHSCC